MPKTLLKTFTTNSSATGAAGQLLDSDNPKLETLMQELQPHLRNAAQDLLQPRPQAVAHILSKILKPS